jgi:magnesium transporter
MITQINTHDRFKDNLEWVQRLLARHDYLLEKKAELRPDTIDSVNESSLRHVTEEIQERIKHLHAADIAHILEALPYAKRMRLWDFVSSAQDGDILLEVSDSVRESLIKAMNEGELLAAVESLDTDEMADLAPDLPQNVVSGVIKNLDDEERKQLHSAMSYDDDLVGSLMDFDVLRVRADVTCEVVLRYLRLFDDLPKHTDNIFVVDDDNTLKGILPIRRLLVAQPDTLVDTTMEKNIVFFQPDNKSEEAAQAFERYDLITAPVVNSLHKLIGRLTVDAMVDVIRETSDEDRLQMAGLKEEEDLFAPIIKSFKNRWAWIAINLATAFFASSVIQQFETAIAQLVALASLMPIVAGLGGNAGNQTITMIVRSLAMGHLQFAQAYPLWRKELGVALLNGLVWGALVGLITFIMYQDTALAVLIMVAITLNFMLAATMGVFIPMIMHHFGRDPAVGSSVLITACTDSGGFFIFLGLASAFLM